jgi:hypothetical protein
MAISSLAHLFTPEIFMTLTATPRRQIVPQFLGSRDDRQYALGLKRAQRGSYQGQEPTAKGKLAAINGNDRHVLALHKFPVLKRLYQNAIRQAQRREM